MHVLLLKQKFEDGSQSRHDAAEKGLGAAQ